MNNFTSCFFCKRYADDYSFQVRLAMENRYISFLGIETPVCQACNDAYISGARQREAELQNLIKELKDEIKDLKSDIDNMGAEIIRLEDKIY